MMAQTAILATAKRENAIEEFIGHLEEAPQEALYGYHGGEEVGTAEPGENRPGVLLVIATLRVETEHGEEVIVGVDFNFYLPLNRRWYPWYLLAADCDCPEWLIDGGYTQAPPTWPVHGWNEEAE